MGGKTKIDEGEVSGKCCEEKGSAGFRASVILSSSCKL
jgi:hypothetical protein